MLRADLDCWLQDVAAQRKPATLRYYQSRSRWILRSVGELTWDQLTPAKVLRGLDQANRKADGSHMAADTIRANTIAWEQFQKWAVATGRIEKLIVEQMPAKPAGRQRERLPSPADVEQILSGASAEFAAIYTALLLTGSRPGELCRARISDYRPVDSMIQLSDHKTVAKTRRPRNIPISAGCRPILLAAIGERTEGPIFLSPQGSAWTTDKLSQTFRRRRNALGLGNDLVLYSTRHKFATELCHAKGIEAAAAVLGHSGLQTIRRYVHHDAEQLVKYADAVDPSSLVPPAKSPSADALNGPDAGETSTSESAP